MARRRDAGRDCRVELVVPSRQKLPRRSEHHAVAERLRLVAQQVRQRRKALRSGGAKGSASGVMTFNCSSLSEIGCSKLDMGAPPPPMVGAQHHTEDNYSRAGRRTRRSFF